jgi:hypothetical protein
MIALGGALLLAGGVGAAFAQTNNPRLNAAPTVTTTPSGKAAATVSPSGPHAQNPRVNPSAAGTQTGSTSSAAPKRSVKGDGEYGGSKEINANTHPLAALKARKQMQKQNGNLPPSMPSPRQTNESGAGR